MKFLATLVSFVASATAADLYLHTNNDCGGSNALRCNGANPNTCCGTAANDSPYQSVALRGINAGWNVQLRGYTNGNCATLNTISGNNGNDWICNRSNGFRYTGAGYNFVGKRARRAAAAESDSETESECRRPDDLVLADGTEYDLTSLSDEEYANLVARGIESITAKDLPEELQALRIK